MKTQKIQKTPKKAKTQLSVFDQHRLKIAYATLKMNDVSALIMGGMTKAEAREVIYKLTGKRSPL